MPKKRTKKDNKSLAPAENNYMSLIESIQITGSPEDLLQSAENVGSAVAGITAMLKYWDRMQKRPDDIAKVFLLLGGIAGKIAAGYVATSEKFQQQFKRPSERVIELEHEIYELQQLKKIKQLEAQLEELKREIHNIKSNQGT